MRRPGSTSPLAIHVATIAALCALICAWIHVPSDKPWLPSTGVSEAAILDRTQQVCALVAPRDRAWRTKVTITSTHIPDGAIKRIWSVWSRAQHTLHNHAISADWDADTGALIRVANSLDESYHRVAGRSGEWCRDRSAEERSAWWRDRLVPLAAAGGSVWSLSESEANPGRNWWTRWTDGRRSFAIALDRWTGDLVFADIAYHATAVPRRSR